MRSLLLVIVVIGVGLFSGFKVSFAEVDFVPYQAFVKETLDDMEFLFQEKELSKVEQINRLEEVWNNRFSSAYVARFILGPYARKAKKESIARFEKVFARVTALSLLERVATLGELTYSFEISRDMKSSVIITTRFVSRGRATDIGWRLIYRNGRYSIMDIVIADISLLQSFRSEYTAYLRGNKGDLDELVEELERKLATVVKNS